MRYLVEISKSLEKTLIKIPKRERTQIIDKIDSLSENPRPEGIKKLKGHKKPYLYRIRSGNYRIVYTIEDHILTILVIAIGHRKEIYQEFNS